MLDRILARLAAFARRLRRLERRELAAFGRWIQHTGNLLHLTVLVAVPLLIAVVTVVSNALTELSFLLFPPLAAGAYTLFSDPEGRYGSPQKFVVGHVVGSATSQITLGVGVVALLAPLSATREEVTTYGAGMVVAMLVMLLAIASGTVTRLQGVVMALAYIGFVAFRYEHTDDGGVGSRLCESDTVDHPLPWVVLGLALVIAGGHLLVTGARGVAAAVGVPTYLLGLLTGLGTTTPEIVVAALAVRRERGGIAVGTLFGSNITGPLFSLGVGAAVATIAVENLDATLLSVGYMLAVSAAVALLFYRRDEVGRFVGVGCLLLYVPALFLG
jgi:cation:H+ antiporter